MNDPLADLATPPGTARRPAKRALSTAAPILPGAVIGVLGSGQLGRMFAIAARRMGYRVHTFSPDADTPTGQVSDVEVRASFDDLDAVRRFARGVAVVTFEFENVPFAATQAAAECAPVRPDGSVLYTTQHRLREKTFLAAGGFPVAPWRPVRSLTDLHEAIVAIGLPAVLKTAGFGYDGKGQTLLREAADAAAAWDACGGQEMVLEGFIDFVGEVSVVVARGVDGQVAHWGAVENVHVHHILDVSVSPSSLPPALEAEACEMAVALAESLGVVGILCVEMFHTRDGRLLVNELAPRPHNSGHFTFDASVTSQFEQQLRASCGLPLGSTRLLSASAMANLLGDLWQAGEPHWAAAAAHDDVKLHLYGKLLPRPGRKMGHMTALAATPAEARARALAARAALSTERG